MKTRSDAYVAFTYGKWNKEEPQRPSSLDYPHHYARKQADQPYEWN